MRRQHAAAGSVQQSARHNGVNITYAGVVIVGMVGKDKNEIANIKEQNARNPKSQLTSEISDSGERWRVRVRWIEFLGILYALKHKLKPKEKILFF